MKKMLSGSNFLCYFKKADIFLLTVFLMMGVGSIMAVKLQPESGSTVVISVNGEQYGSYPLNTDREISVDTAYGHNTVVISSGTVTVTESNCRNHDCEHSGAISRPAQSIICLPHRMIVRITGKADVDAVIC